MHDDYGHDLIPYEDTLAHYGVLGMRWGVHRGLPSYAYAKATIKKNKLQGKVDKLEKKASDAAYKASTGAKTKTKYTKLQAKNLKAQKKYDEWVKAMDEVFTSDLMKTINPAAILNAKEYVKTFDYLRRSGSMVVYNQ